MEGDSLRNVYPELYEVSLLKAVSIGAMGGWIDGNWLWGDLGISESLLVESGLLGKYTLLRDSLLHSNGPMEVLGKDEVMWIGGDSLDFTVASCYDFYERDLIPFGPYFKFDEAYRHFWKAEVPFKIKPFGWRLLLDRLPTKELLVFRGISIPLDKLMCTFCGYGVENRNHFFFCCRVVKDIWFEIALWVGKSVSAEGECLSNFMD
ncbi:uncharacterized protein LOC131619191 [Vicia villosa]|uniref:uncharacterized protein LOC131619191 n=1 Tax=Vicia villosa TaxID=3911 RepID=UPI00273A8F0B|nr:uncharacterized protein LOC131619191 [Vicia villosa]